MVPVDLVHISRQYPGSAEPVIRDVSLQIGDGEFTALLGPSGSGKTTLLRMIAGLDDPDSGDIRIAGRSVIGLEPKERDIALVFQQYALYPQMTVFENIEYPLKVQKMEKGERQARVNATAGRLGLTHLLDRRPGELSGGEQQRVALGRAIVREPAVFLMDEPLSNLDATLRMEMRSELRSLQQQLGVTTIFVTHDQSEAMTMASRIVLLNNGVIQQEGVPDELYDRPANIFVAGFIGSPPMNLLPARRIKDQLITDGGWTLPAPERDSRERVIAGIRPEGITLSLDHSGEVFPVYLSEAHGSEAIVNVRVGEEIVRVRTHPRLRPEPGTLVSLEADRLAVRLFDETTGLRIE